MEPITRKEKFLAAAGGQDVDLPTPVTREEVFLKAIAEGGGGSSLPDVTSADNGKILKVVNGDWAAEYNDVVVNITKVNDNWYTNVSAPQVETALAAGKNVYATVAGVLVTNDNSIKNATLILPLTGIHNDFYAFGGTYRSASQTIEVTFTLTNSLLYQNNMYSRTYNALEQKSGTGGQVLQRTGNGENDYGWADVGPAYVTYTITGQPSGGIYPLSADASLEYMLGAISDGRDVIAILPTAEGTIFMRLVSFSSATGSEFIAFSAVTYYNNAWCVFQVNTHTHAGSSTDVSDGQIIPLSTAQMSFDSSTNTLAITQ